MDQRQSSSNMRVSTVSGARTEAQALQSRSFRLVETMPRRTYEVWAVIKVVGSLQRLAPRWQQHIIRCYIDKGGPMDLWITSIEVRGKSF